MYATHLFVTRSFCRVELFSEAVRAALQGRQTSLSAIVSHNSFISAVFTFVGRAAGFEHPVPTRSRSHNHSKEVLSRRRFRGVLQIRRSGAVEVCLPISGARRYKEVCWRWLWVRSSVNFRPSGQSLGEQAGSVCSFISFTRFTLY